MKMLTEEIIRLMLHDTEEILAHIEKNPSVDSMAPEARCRYTIHVLKAVLEEE